MWFEHTIPAPERTPDVPVQLGDCVREFLSGTTRIDVHVRVGQGWQKVNALHFEEGDDTVEPEVIAALVKACADHHAAQATAGGKYRAMIWRYFCGELERRKARFDVELVSPPKRPQPPPRRSRRDQWRTAFETTLMLEEILAQPTGPHVDPLAALRRTTETPLERVHRELAEMAEIYGEGSSTGTPDGMALAEIRIRWKLACLRGQEDADVWTAVAPTIEAGLARLREDALTEPTTTSDVEPPKPTSARAGAPTAGQADDPDAERKEGAPPSSGDAPSPGRMRSGA